MRDDAPRRAGCSEDDLLGALGEEWPSCLAYIVSFTTIGAVWFAHTVITEYLHHITSVFDGPARVAATVYGVNLFLASLLISTLASAPAA